MDLPLSSTDIRIAIACQIRNGNGGFGPRTAVYTDGKKQPGAFNACTTCSGTGWTLKRIPELTATERERLLAKLK